MTQTECKCCSTITAEEKTLINKSQMCDYCKKNCCW